MEELKLMVPTYYGAWLKDSDCELADFDEPIVPVLVHQAEGVRIVLGTHERNGCEKPDIQIERRRNGWMIFLHPVGGCDASGYVLFFDDGRSFVVKERGAELDYAIEFAKYEEVIAEIDGIKEASPSSETNQPPVPASWPPSGPSTRRRN